MAPVKTVLATGVFDILHPGHLGFLEEARKTGGPKSRLIVVIARDETVQRRKGRTPVVPESERRRMVAALKPVTDAVLGHKEVDFLGTLKEIQPDIVCVGYDQNDIKSSVTKIIKSQKLPMRVVQLPKFGVEGLNSSTGIKKRVIRSQASPRSLR